MRFVPACFAYLILLRKDSDEEEEKRKQKRHPPKAVAAAPRPRNGFFFLLRLRTGERMHKRPLSVLYASPENIQGKVSKEKTAHSAAYRKRCAKCSMQEFNGGENELSQPARTHSTAADRKRQDALISQWKGRALEANHVASFGHWAVGCANRSCADRRRLGKRAPWTTDGKPSVTGRSPSAEVACRYSCRCVGAELRGSDIG